MNLPAASIRTVALALLLGVAALAPAQDKPAAPAAVDLGVSFDAAARSPEALAKAMELLEAMRAAYRAAPTIVDKVTVRVESPNGAKDDRFEVRVGKGVDAQLRLNGATITALDGKLTFMADQPADKAVVVPLDKNIEATIGKLMPGIAPIPAFLFRYRDAVNLPDLALGAFTGATLAGYRTTDGTAQLLLRGDSNAQAVLTVDAATQLLKSAEMQFVPPSAPDIFVIKVKLSYEPTVAADLPEPITVDTSSRTIVGSMSDLLPKAIAVGDAAPDWTLKRSDGAEVSLSSLRGSVVVIDFWATWCGPCKLALPYVEEFARWASANGKNVKVFAINSLETGDAAMRARNATQYWTDQAFTIPLLLDLDDRVFESYRPANLPATFIIGPNGRVAAIHEGVDTKNPAAVAETLRHDVTALLATPVQR